jgi:hypothetical protein
MRAPQPDNSSLGACAGIGQLPDLIYLPRLSQPPTALKRRAFNSWKSHGLPAWLQTANLWNAQLVFFKLFPITHSVPAHHLLVDWPVSATYVKYIEAARSSNDGEHLEGQLGPLLSSSALAYACLLETIITTKIPNAFYTLNTKFCAKRRGMLQQIWQWRCWLPIRASACR